MIKSVIGELHFVIRRQEKSIQILWKCISWNCQKLPPEEKNETSLLQWMRFLGGKTRKDFEEMAKKNSELEEAYDVLDKLSADEKKRLEYETRQRAIRDYNIGMLTAERRGIEAGREEGENRINQLKY